MKIVFLSNYFNHHQKYLSDAFYKITNSEYVFMETEEMTEEHVKMGYKLELPPYVVSVSDYENNKEKQQSMIDDADVVIIGSAPNELVKNRIKSNKLTFRYSERLFKKKPEWWKTPIRLLKFKKFNPPKKPLYMLSASAFTSADYAKYRSFKNKCYKWAYFTEVIKYEDIETLINNKTKNSILWCARFLELKHPELAVEIAKRLKQDGYAFNLSLIGSGDKFLETEELVEKYNLGDCVNLLGVMTPNEVRRHMEKSEIFLFTSDRNEGWGAVLNESMNSACVPVASHIIGSVPFLIKDGENGLIYKDGDVDDLYNKVKYLLDNKEKRVEMAKRAYKTMLEEWNGEVAAEKFIKLCEMILSGEKKPFPFESGVCSKAEILKDDWYNA